MPWMVCIGALCILVALVCIWRFATMRCVRSGDAMDGGGLAEIARTFSGQVSKFLENNRTLPTVASTNIPSNTPSAVGTSCVDQKSSCAWWASQGYCLGATKDWMSSNCSRSCTPSCSVPTSGDAATKPPPTALVGNTPPPSTVAVSSASSVSSVSSATPPPPPATFTACIQNSTPDPTFKAIRQLKKCSELLSQSQVDQDHFYPPVNGRPLCQHYKSLGYCDFDENTKKMCPATCSNAPPKPKRPPRSGGGIDVPCFPAMTNVSYTDRTNYLRAVMPLFMFQDDFDYSAITGNQIDPYLVNSTSNRDLIHPMWVNNPRVFVVWNGFFALVAPRPQRPTTQMTVTEIKAVIASLNYLSFISLVYTMAFKRPASRTTGSRDPIRPMSAERDGFIVIRPSRTPWKKDVRPGPTDFMSEWLEPKTVVAMAQAYGLDLPHIWPVQTLMTFRRKESAYVAEHNTTHTNFTPVTMDWNGCKDFWGDRESMYELDEMRRVRQSSNINEKGEFIDHPIPGITQSGITGFTTIAQDLTHIPVSMVLQFIDTFAMAVTESRALMHEMSHSMEHFYALYRKRKAIANNEPDSALLKDPRTEDSAMMKYFFTTSSSYINIFSSLRKETTGYLSGAQWKVQEHFAEMTMRVVYNMFYEIIVQSIAASQSIACGDMIAIDDPMHPMHPMADVRLYQNLAATNPEWVAPAEAIRKEFMIDAAT